MRRGSSTLLLVAGLLLAAPLALGAHYTCSSDEVQGEVQGGSGLICGPKCAAGTLECPGDVAAGVTAEPQCMLQDQQGGRYCGLLCQIDTQCATGSTCRNLGTVRVCMRPLSFSEWAQGSRTRLFVNLPPAQNGAKGAAVAKAYAALQTLKKKYGISDGDTDVLAIKEILMAAHHTNIKSVGHPGSSPAAAVASAGGPGPIKSLAGQVTESFRHLEHNLEKGLPGVEQEFVVDTEYNLQHGHYWTILRDFLTWVVVYLVVGCAYKFHTAGARGADMIPHIGFWLEYPNLVNDGVAYLRFLVTGVSPSQEVRKPPGAFGGSSLGRSARDTFSSNFEPNLL